ETLKHFRIVDSNEMPCPAVLSGGREESGRENGLDFFGRERCVFILAYAAAYSQKVVQRIHVSEKI
ncbi:MAG: hypothetical protein K2G81_01810, partial [Muribaculaceae bacterium]|nr:hypothetical protein [Muribaculaceae bacterium]